MARFSKAHGISMQAWYDNYTKVRGILTINAILARDDDEMERTTKEQECEATKGKNACGADMPSMVFMVLWV